ncbi:MAG: succinate dehydrogenase, hydrophobic membrane anchor protein [Gammaproteobacteria bacterium]
MKGSMIWKLQRYSSLLILSYLSYLIFFIFTHDLNFFSWSNFFLSFQIRILTSLVFISILLHSFIGLWTVGTDYLTNRVLGFLNKSLARRARALRTIYSFFFLLIGVSYLTITLYVIWI